MFQSLQQLFKLQKRITGKKRKVKLHPEVQMRAKPTAHRTSGDVFMWVYLRTVVDVVLFSVTSGEHLDSGHCPPLLPVEGMCRGRPRCAAQEKFTNFCYQSIMYVTPATPTPTHPPPASLTAPVSIAQLCMSALASFHSFSVASIMDRHLLRSAAWSVRKPTIQQARCKNNNEPIRLTGKWGGSFVNFWKCKQAEFFVRQIIITGCQIMKGGQMSANVRKIDWAGGSGWDKKWWNGNRNCV